MFIFCNVQCVRFEVMTIKHWSGLH